MTYRSKPRRRQRFSLIAIYVAGAVAVVFGSAWITWKVMDYIDAYQRQAHEAATKEVYPTTWQTTDEGSYEIRDGTVTFHGPGSIFNQVECGSLVSNIRFSVFVDHAGDANMQLQFVAAGVGPIGKPLVQYLGGTINQTVEIRSPTQQGAGLIRAIVYTSRKGETVVFRNPYIECKPVE